MQYRLMMNMDRDIETVAKVSQVVKKACDQIQKIYEEHVKQKEAEAQRERIRNLPPRVHFEKKEGNLPMPAQIASQIEEHKNHNKERQFPHDRILEKESEPSLVMIRKEKKNEPMAKEPTPEKKKDRSREIDKKDLPNSSDRRDKTERKDRGDKTEKGDRGNKGDIRDKTDKGDKKTIPAQRTQMRRSARLPRPKQPISAYLRFNQKNHSIIRQNNPKLNPNEIMKVAGLLWESLSSEQKRPFQQQYQADKLRYDAEMQEFFRQNPDQIGRRPYKRPKRTQADKDHDEEDEEQD